MAVGISIFILTRTNRSIDHESLYASFDNRWFVNDVSPSASTRFRGSRDISGPLASYAMCRSSLANAQDPPQYLVTTMENNQGETFRPTDINNAGLVVLGKYSNPHLFVDVPNTPGLMYDINNLNGAMWRDLETNDMWDQTTTPFIADGATGINENNQIVGTAYVPNGPDRVYVLEDPLGPNPLFKLLPEFGDGVWGNAINADGVVVGTAEGQIVVFDPRTDPDPYTPVGISAPWILAVAGRGPGDQYPWRHRDSHVDISFLPLTPSHPDGSFNYEQAAVYLLRGIFVLRN